MVLSTGSPPASGLLLNLAISENRHDSFVGCHGRRSSWKQQRGMKILKGSECRFSCVAPMPPLLGESLPRTDLDLLDVVTQLTVCFPAYFHAFYRPSTSNACCTSLSIHRFYWFSLVPTPIQSKSIRVFDQV